MFNIKLFIHLLILSQAYYNPITIEQNGRYIFYIYTQYTYKHKQIIKYKPKVVKRGGKTVYKEYYIKTQKLL